MTLAQFLALFPEFMETKKGYDVRCPAHDDRHPSLGIMEGDEGRIVLNCFAGCTPQAVCQALGLRLSDLFRDAPLTGHAEPRQVVPTPIPKRKLAFAYDLTALTFHHAATRILDVAARCEDCDTWTDDDRELAMKAVARAYTYRERAHFCESYADHLREQEYELKRLALG